jgi:hypothetical protein
MDETKETMRSKKADTPLSPCPFRKFLQAFSPRGPSWRHFDRGNPSGEIQGCERICAVSSAG